MHPITRLAVSALLICSASTSIAAQAEPASATVGNAARSIDPAALARAQQKLGNAQRIVQQFSARAAAESLPDSWRTEMLSALMRAPEEATVQVLAAATAGEALTAAHDAANAGSSQPKALGDPAVDLTFIPLPIPCRIVDTRVAGAGGMMAAGTTRKFSFDVLASQGSSACTPFTGYVGFGEPAAAAVTVTVDATGSTAQPGSFIKVFPDGGSTPTSWLNFGGNQIIANAGILSIANAKFDVTVSGATYIIVDVFGSFIRPQATALDCVDTTKVAGTIPAGGKNLRLTANACPSGYGIVSGSCFGGNDTNYYLQESTKTAAGSWLCNWQSYNTVDAEDLAVSSTCCRVPGR